MSTIMLKVILLLWLERIVSWAPPYSNRKEQFWGAQGGSKRLPLIGSWEVAPTLLILQYN